MIKGAVFDVDGTLLDTMHMWSDVGERYLGSFGITPPQGFSQLIHTMTLVQFSDHIIDTYHINKKTDEIIEDICSLVSDYYEYEAMPKRGALEFLDVLYKKEIPMTVATSSDRSYLAKAFKRLDMEKYFQGLYTCREENTSKNSPDIYITAARDFNCADDEIYVFEDVLHAVKSAKKAGYKVVSVYDDEAKKDIDAIKAESDAFITDFNDLLFKEKNRRELFGGDINA